MNWIAFFSLILSVSLLSTGCATTPKAKPAPVTQTAPDARDTEISNLKNQLDEQKVLAAEAEARAAKAENDRIETESLKTSKPKDPYLK